MREHDRHGHIRRTLRRFVYSGLLVGLIGATTPSVASADIEDMVLHVKGLACPFCAYGLEKKVARLDGVEALEIQMDEGRVVLTLAPMAEVTIDQLERAVGDAGFTLDGVEVTVTGTLVQRGGDVWLEWGDGLSAILEWQDREQRDRVTPEPGAREVRVSGRAHISERIFALFVVDVGTVEYVN